ncbi:MAG: hypothetical protein ACPGXX_01525, partial [Planctomycetaceae bacterium]
LPESLRRLPANSESTLRLVIQRTHLQPVRSRIARQIAQKSGWSCQFPEENAFNLSVQPPPDSPARFTRWLDTQCTRRNR